MGVEGDLRKGRDREESGGIRGTKGEERKVDHRMERRSRYRTNCAHCSSFARHLSNLVVFA